MAGWLHGNRFRCLVTAVVCIMASGCAAKTYPVVHTRANQELTGSRNAPSEELSQVALPEEPSSQAASLWEKAHEVPKPATGTLAQEAMPYKVSKGDTLQKISMRFYGTTKRWMKIFDANRNLLSSPEKLYPGQVLSIPVEPMREPKENLK